MEVNDESGNMQVLVLTSTFGRFSNDGGDDKENAKKATSFKKHNNNFNHAVNFQFGLLQKRQFISIVFDDL